MCEKTLGQELLDHAKNFDDIKDGLCFSPSSDESVKDLFLCHLENVYLTLKADISCCEGMYGYQLDDRKKLELIYKRCFNFAKMNAQDSDICSEDHPFYQDVYNIGLFMTLCMFLHNTNKTKSISLRKFTYEYSHMKYNEKGSGNYFDFNKRGSQSEQKDRFHTEENALRKHRNVQFSKGGNEIHTTEWRAMPKSSEHEWALWFSYFMDIDLNISFDQEMKDTFKRIWNLYNGIDETLNSPMDDSYLERLDRKLGQFKSKAEKISYQSYLKLCQFILAHLEKEPKYWGINLYRLEKMLHIYQFIHEVALLSACQNEDEEVIILSKRMAIGDICFPRLRYGLHQWSSLDEIKRYAQTFQEFITQVVHTTRILIDRFIEDGIWEDNWENLFLTTTKDLTELVLFDHKTLDFSTNNPMAQKKFSEILITPVCHNFYYKTMEYAIYTQSKNLSTQ